MHETDMECIFDRFERELTSDILALTNIGKRISGNKELMITFIGNIPSVYTDCRFIYLPEKFKKDLKSAQGLVAHEAGHIGYGSFELCFIKLVDTLTKKYNISPLFAKNVINVIEDIRINSINKKRFPGFYRNLRMLTYKLIPEIRTRIGSHRDILSYLNLYMEDFEDFQKRPKFDQLEISKIDWRGIKKIRKFLFKSLSPSASIISCDVMCNILKKYIPERSVDQTPNRGNFARQSRETINQIELNARNKRNDEKTKLDKTSEELIEKLKNHNLEPEDLNEFMDNEEENVKGNNNEEQEDKEKGRECREGCDEAGRGWKENKENLDTLRSNGVPNVKSIIDNVEMYDLLDNIENSVALENLQEDLSTKQLNKTKSINDIKESLIKEIQKIIERANDAMQERLLTLERQEYQPSPRISRVKRYVNEVKIESQAMIPDSMTYAQIKSKYIAVIKRLKLIFTDLKNKTAYDTFQKRGRLNNKLIKTITSDYQFKKCFTRKIIEKDLRLIIIIDISGSMRGIKVRAAKIAMIMLYEALEQLAKIRIVLFTGAFHALNILVKDFNETLDSRKFDKFGCHINFCQNVDGVSIKHEADKLEKDDIIIVISDGQPAADGGYSLYDAIPDIHEVRKKFRVFAFSIDSQGEYLNKLYGKDWILANSRNELDLGEKLIKFSQILVKEFYR